MITKEFCIQKYNEYKSKNKGAIPKFKDFCEFAELPKRALGKLYRCRNSYAQLQKDCGDEASQLNLKRTPQETIMRQYGDLALDRLHKQLEGLPNSSDWVHLGLKPSPEGLARKPHNIKWSEFPQVFKDWVNNERAEGYDRVLDLIDNQTDVINQRQERKDREFEALVKAIRSWSPAHGRNVEEAYKIELRAHLESLRYKVNEEYGESTFDLLIDRKYAIETKKAPNLGEYDRLLGQLARHLQHQQRVIAVIFDAPRADTYKMFSSLVDEYLNKDENRVEIIKK
jgi:hypothetical protein